MNKATLTRALLGGLLIAMPLAQAQTTGPSDPVDEQGPAFSPPLDSSPGSSGEDPQRRGEDKGREGLPSDLNQDDVTDPDLPDTQPLPGDDMEGDSDRDSNY